MSVSQEPLRIESSADGRTSCLALVGELTYTTTPQFDDEVRRAVDASRPHLLVDAARLHFCDSVGLSALIGAHRRATALGGGLALRGVHGTLARALRVTGLEAVFTVCAEPATATDDSSVG